MTYFQNSRSTCYIGYIFAIAARGRWGKDLALSLSLLCCLLLVTGCAPLHPFANLEEWQEIQTTNFTFYTNAEEQEALDIATKLEVFRAVALTITTIPPFVEKRPVRVYLFKNRRSYAPFQPSKNMAGYFIPEMNFIALPADGRGVSQFSTIYHEYIHYLISKSPHNIPRWYNEGLATMAETFQFVDGDIKFGEPERGRWRYMEQQAKWIPMDTFISDQTDYDHKDRDTHAHSQAWALMHYFFYGDNTQNFVKLERYLDLLNNGSSYDVALMSAFGLTPEELLEEVKNYLSKSSLLYGRLRREDVTKGDDYQTRPLGNDEAKQIIQDLLELVLAFRKNRSTP